jgi:hypothetical protein
LRARIILRQASGWADFDTEIAVDAGFVVYDEVDLLKGDDIHRADAHAGAAEIARLSMELNHEYPLRPATEKNYPLRQVLSHDC